MDLVNEKLKKLLASGHAKPVTRRQFISHGLIAGGATLFLPDMFSLFGSGNALAAEAGVPDVPFLVMDLAGGAALPGSFLVGRNGGPEDFLKSYDTLGWDPREGGALDTSMGLPMSAKYSFIAKGIYQTTSAEARRNFRMGSIAHFSQDDTSNNESSAVALVGKSGFKGVHLPTGLGQKASLSGGNSEAIGKDALFKPLAISRVTDVTESLSFGPGLKGARPDVLRALGLSAKRLSALQATRLKQKRRGAELGAAAEKAYQSNLTYAEGVQGVDPRLEADFQKVYGINPNTSSDNADAVKATIVMNLLKRTAGAGVITIDDCDYHNRGIEAQDAIDLIIGKEIGRAVEAAHRMGKPLFMQILTDGGCLAKDNIRSWEGDSGIRSLTVMGYYNPKGASSQPRLQVGQYTDGQGADRDTLVGTDAKAAAYAVFANYLSVCGRLGEFENTVARGILTPQQLDSLLVFG